MKTLKELIENGFAVSKAAKKLNISLKEAKKEIEKNDYSLKLETFDDSKINYICNLYAEGISAKQLGIKYKIDKRRILKWVKNKGTLRNRNDAIRQTFFNQKKFDSIDSKEKAYWLGFFYADAYNASDVCTLIITLSSLDKNHLTKLANFVNLPEDKIIEREQKNGNKIYKSCTLKLYSKHICDKLTELGCPRAKSFIIKYPKWLNENLHSHFIRGIFDGDGSLSQRSNKEWKFSIVSTKECVEDISNIILNKTNKKTHIRNISKTGNNTYELETNGNEKITSIMNWIYKNSDDNCRLDRKYDKYKELLNQQQNKISKSSINFINKYSSKCLLGPIAKEDELFGNLFIWKVNKKNHFSMIGNDDLSIVEIERLKQFKELNFHYLTKSNTEILKNFGEIRRSKGKSIILDINEIKYSGKKNRAIRNYMNRYSNYIIKNDFNDMNEINMMIDEWSETLGEKYFRDFSGKNKFFFSKGFHKDCDCVFIYNKDNKLISFGVASPVVNGYCSYVIGKALSKSYPGLAEFTDMKLYELLLNKYGKFKINMGQATKGLLFYKKKFPNSTEIEHYNGKITFR